MPTKNLCLNITFEPDIAALLNSLAKLEEKSVSSMAKELILEALEQREDMVLSKIAETREQQPSPLLNHDDIWK